MKTTEWLEHYEKIVKTLGIDPEKDIQSARLLSQIISGRSATRKELAAVLRKKAFAVVFGAAPSLEYDLDMFLRFFEPGDASVVAVDGAVKAFQELGVRPDVVVTDLDGGEEALLKASLQDVFLVVHAHGDNADKIIQLVPRLRGKILGTTQTEPVGVLENFGGFTDGDRAVFMCEEIGVGTIVVAGMDFEGEIGKHSKPRPLSAEETARKKIKLQIGKTLLETLASKTYAILYDASGNPSKIKGFRKVSWKQLKKELGQDFTQA
ncbi:MAG: DUF115 domain-containing protein [Candidatus Caldarchaeum sp.]|nr:DUF115 domain-containing protein [Candidatus Caldarchaeum sp.]